MNPPLRPPSSAKRIAAFVLLVACAYALFVAIVMRPYVIDDAYIGFRYVDNVVHGRGFVFNPPFRVEGVTNIGWLLMMLPFAWIFPVPAVAKVLSYLCLLAGLIVIQRLIAHLAGKGGALSLPGLWPLVMITNFEFILFSSGGMETAAVSLGLSLTILLAVSRRNLNAAAALGAFLFLVRPECLLVFPVAWFFLHGTGGAAAWKKNILSLAIFALLIGGFTAARLAYFGDVLPNTFAAKPSSFEFVRENALHFLTGAASNVGLPFVGWFVIPFWIAGIWRIRRLNRIAAAFASAILACGLAFALYAKLDWTNTGRYFAPYVPLATLFFLAGFAELLGRVHSRAAGRDRSGWILGFVSLAFIVFGAVRTWTFLASDQKREYPGFVIAGTSLVEPSLWIRDHVPEGAVIAAGRIGAISYFSGKRIFDYKFGLTERDVARAKKAARREFTDPRDPALERPWLEAKPDYFLEDLDRVREIFRLGPGEVSSLNIHGWNYRFLRKFKVGLFTDWTLFVRADVTEESRGI